jgi:hypothetical protein
MISALHAIEKHHINIFIMTNTEKIFFLTHDIQSSEEHTLMNDRRASKRFNHDTPIVIKNCDSQNCSYGRMYNYSQGGIYFESDTPYQIGTRVRIGIERSKSDLDAGLYFAEVKWCAEISAAVVLYDYGIGAELDPKMNPTAANEKFKVIKGGAKRNTT